MLRIARDFWNLILRRATVNRANEACINTPDEHIDSPRQPVGGLFERLEESRASRQVLRSREESVFTRQGDYWTIRYQGQAAILKATRGLDYLGYLLRHPVRDVHVTELLGTAVDRPVPLVVGLRVVGSHAVTSGLQDAG